MILIQNRQRHGRTPGLARALAGGGNLDLERASRRPREAGATAAACQRKQEQKSGKRHGDADPDCLPVLYPASIPSAQAKEPEQREQQRVDRRRAVRAGRQHPGVIAGGNHSHGHCSAELIFRRRIEDAACAKRQPAA